MKERLSNIELLRIISMFMVIVLHLLNFGNLLGTYNNFSLKAFFVWFLESLCFVAVNCYVIISGYFLIDSNFKFKKIIKLWIEVLFYSITIYLVLLLTNNITFSFRSLLKSFFPFLLKNYWFVTIYMLLYIISPLLNKFLKCLNKIQYSYLLFVILMFFSIWPTIFSPANTSDFGGSYSITWFICLYIIAGYLKRFYSDKKLNKFVLFYIYLGISIINVLTLLLINKFNLKFIVPDFLYNYYSITMVFSAIILFLLFNNLSIKSRGLNKFICFFAPTTFGIYLIHENPSFREVLWNKFYFVAHESLIKMIVLMIIIPIVLFVTFALIDKIRILLFNSLAKLNLNFDKIAPIRKLKKNCKKLEEYLCQK